MSRRQSRRRSYGRRQHDIFERRGRVRSADWVAGPQADEVDADSPIGSDADDYRHHRSGHDFAR